MPNRSLSLLVLAAIVLLALIAYWPGLHGNFLFDDFANLPSLGDTGPVDTWPTFWRYITSGIADPTGRPLTLLTFLLDARNWPANPYPFKRTSLILHLVNGLLLYALLTRLGRALHLEARRCQWAAALGAGLWLLHPLLVSTTLYIVQREAMLPATCILIGLLIWMHGRNQLVNGQLPRGTAWSIIGLGLFTLLGVLAKANGALLPLLALLIEWVVLAPCRAMTDERAKRVHRCLLWLLCGVPAMAIAAYLGKAALYGLLAHGPHPGRPWSIAQRLLTEPRVLMDYLSLLWLPRPLSTGLFNDQYVASISLLHPMTTLPAVATVLLLIGGAIALQRRHPAMALAVLFYFGGQVLESTSLPLELYFEHRNYVPALLMFWPLGLWLADTRTLKMPKLALMVVLPLALAGMTHARAQVWGDVRMQALIWARINPDSARAQANAAQIEMANGHPRDAARRLEKVLAVQPEQMQLAFNLIGAHCMMSGLEPSDIPAAQAAMRGSPNTGTLFAHWFDRILPVALAGHCAGLTTDDLQSLIEVGLKNPRLAAAGPQQDLTYLRSRIALAQHQPDLALADFIRALDLQVRPAMALKAAAELGAAGYPNQGLRLLDHYQHVASRAMQPSLGMPMLHEWVLAKQGYWPQELGHLRQQLELDVNAASANTAHPHVEQGAAH